MNTPRPAAAAELPALTGLRGFAAVWVLLYHAWVDAGPRLMTLGSGAFALDFTPLFSCGWAGVDVFFTLSAFLLSLPFASWQLGLAPRPSLRTFWLRRVLRIFPAWYTQVAVLLILAGVFAIGTWPSTGQLIGNLLLYFNFGTHGVVPLNAVTYTLPIEFCFYLVLPLLAFALRPRWWWLLALFAIVETQLYRHLMFADVAQADVPLRVIVLEQLPGRLDQFVFGMLAAYAYCRAAMLQRLPSPRSCDLLLLLGMLVVALMCVLIHFDTRYWDGSRLLFVWHGIVGAAVALMLYACAAGSRIARALFANRVLHYLGVISFGLYLWHYPLIHWLDAAHVFDRIDGYRLPWSLPLVLVLACAIADVSYRFIERPLLRLGRARSKHPGVTTELATPLRTPEGASS
jgi:peptidoglycan/LPS O-acetylase OafA/YrhL